MDDSLHKVIDSLNRLISNNSTSHSLYDISKDFILPSLFALSAAGIAYFTFYKSIKNDRKKEKEIKESENRDWLFYISSLITRAMHSISFQIDFLKVTVEEINNTPSAFSTHYYTNGNDIRKLSETKFEKFLLAYVNTNTDKRSVLINDVNLMTAAIERIYYLIEDLKTRWEKFSYSVNEESKIFKENFKKTKDILEKATEAWLISNQNLHNQLTTYILEMNFIPEKNEDAITIIQNKFFNPLFEICTSLIKEYGKENYLVELKDMSVLAQINFNNLKSLNVTYGIILNEIIPEMESAYSILENYSTNLRDNFSQ